MRNLKEKTMEEILFGVALGQLLAMAILIALELSLSLIFWGFAELLWKSLIRGLGSVFGRFMSRRVVGGLVHVR
jgi:hypothetical protein